MKRIFIDTNIFIRYLTADDPVKYERCRTLFKKALNGEIALLTSDMVIAELIWTLQSFYRVPKKDVVEKINIIINTPFIFIPNRELLSEALLLYSRKDIDYIDAYNAVFMKHHKTKKIFSYDKDFDMVEGIERIEP